MGSIKLYGASPAKLLHDALPHAGPRAVLRVGGLEGHETARVPSIGTVMSICSLTNIPWPISTYPQ